MLSVLVLVVVPAVLGLVFYCLVLVLRPLWLERYLQRRTRPSSRSRRSTHEPRSIRSRRRRKIRKVGAQWGRAPKNTSSVPGTGRTALG